MSETEKETPTEKPVDSAPLEAAEVVNLDDLEDFTPETDKTPKLKDYLRSSDAPTRYLLILSFLFAGIALFCFGFLVIQYVKHRHDAQKVVIVKETNKVERVYRESLGEIRVMWTDGELRADVVAECSLPETCEALKERKIEARDVTIPILQESNRSEMMNPARKLLIRNKIAEKLNELKIPGRVVQVDFTDMTIEIAH